MGEECAKQNDQDKERDNQIIIKRIAKRGKTASISREQLSRTRYNQSYAVHDRIDGVIARHQRSGIIVVIRNDPFGLRIRYLSGDTH
jgi:hypothetical protein